jgi:hypothetical protein
LAEEAARTRLEFVDSGAIPSIRVLVVSADRPKTRGLYESLSGPEVRVITAALLPHDRVTHLRNASRVKLSEALRAGYDVVHIIAAVEGSGALILDDGPVTPSHLAAILAHRGLLCALFMTCNSASVIGALQATDVPCTIAATSNLYTDYAEHFCSAFYSSLSQGFTVTEAFEHANTLASAGLKPFFNLRQAGALCLISNGQIDPRLRERAL